MKVPAGHPVQSTKEANAEVAKGEGFEKHAQVHSGKGWLSHRKTQNIRQTHVWDTGH